MSASTRIVRVIAALGASVVLAGPVAAAPALAAASARTPAAASTATARESLLGTWVGTYTGFNGGRWESGQEKFVFTTMRGVHVKGTWQSRAKSSQPWSKPSPVQLVVVPGASAGEWTVTGADLNGIYFGSLGADGPRLDLQYQGSVNDLLTYQFTVRKAK